LSNETDTVFFTTNYLAESGLEAIRNLKLRIPEDLGIVVFDDDKLFRLFNPTITAIAQPIVEISEHVIRLMLMLLSGKGGTKKKGKKEYSPSSFVADTGVFRNKTTD
jgi:LacI family transcriptional regulator